MARGKRQLSQLRQKNIAYYLVFDDLSLALEAIFTSDDI
jgi:hypothetical protein